MKQWPYRLGVSWAIDLTGSLKSGHRAEQGHLEMQVIFILKHERCPVWCMNCLHLKGILLHRLMSRTFEFWYPFISNSYLLPGIYSFPQYPLPLMLSMAATISTLRRLKIYFPCSLDMLMNLRLNFTLNWVLFIQFQRLILKHFLPGISKALSYKWNSLQSLKWERVLFLFKLFHFETACSALHESLSLPSWL